MSYFKYIVYFLSIFIFFGCLSLENIHKTYQKGNKAWVTNYEKKEDNIPLISLEGEIENRENEKIKGLINKAIDSLDISLEGLIIINSHLGGDSEYYYMFPKGVSNYYYFYNFLYTPTTLNVFKESKNSSNNEAIITVFNYFNSSDYKEKRLHMDFCDGYSMMYLTVLKVENKKIKLFYLDPMDMCKNDNAFETLKGDEIVRWEFSNAELKENPISRIFNP